jgi:hypothetical protein
MGPKKVQQKQNNDDDVEIMDVEQKSVKKSVKAKVGEKETSAVKKSVDKEVKKTIKPREPSPVPVETWDTMADEISVEDTGGIDYEQEQEQEQEQENDEEKSQSEASEAPQNVFRGGSGRGGDRNTGNVGTDTRGCDRNMRNGTGDMRNATGGGRGFGGRGRGDTRNGDTRNGDTRNGDTRSNDARNGNTRNGGNVDTRNSGNAARFANSVTNFDYKLYESLDTPVNELSNKDLVKILIVRTHNENQYDFKKTMLTVLRATNLECPMPGTRPLGDMNQGQGVSQGFGQGSSQFTLNSNPRSQSRPRTGSGMFNGGGPKRQYDNRGGKSSDPHDF